MVVVKSLAMLQLVSVGLVVNLSVGEEESKMAPRLDWSFDLLDFLDLDDDDLDEEEEEEEAATDLDDFLALFVDLLSLGIQVAESVYLSVWVSGFTSISIDHNKKATTTTTGSNNEQYCVE